MASPVNRFVALSTSLTSVPVEEDPTTGDATRVSKFSAPAAASTSLASSLASEESDGEDGCVFGCS